MTFEELLTMDDDRGDYPGGLWIEACRAKLNEIRLGWQHMKDDTQRRDVQEGIRSIMDHIALRKSYTPSVSDWDRFRAECDTLSSEWNDLWFNGWPKGKAVPGKVFDDAFPGDHPTERAAEV